MGLFAKTNIERDVEVLKQEKERQSYNKDWSTIYWKPVPKSELRNDEEITEEVGIRIFLPAGNVEGADWFVKMSKHFIRHSDGGFEQFTCMKEVYGEPCEVCDKNRELLEQAKAEKDKDKKDAFYKEANAFKPTRFGVFNVLGVKYVTNHKTGKSERLIDDKVKMFQSPISLWTRIVNIHSGRGRSSDIFDAFDEKDNIIKAGRDIIIVYDKDQVPANRYTAIPTDYVNLGTPEQIADWVGQLTPLVPDKLENVASRVDPEVVHIKAFGSKQERMQLKDLLKEMWIEKKKEEEAKNGNIINATDIEVKEDVKEIDGIKEEEKEVKPEVKPEVKEEEEKSSVKKKILSLREKLDKIKEKQD